MLTWNKISCIKYVKINNQKSQIYNIIVLDIWYRIMLSFRHTAAQDTDLHMQKAHIEEKKEDFSLKLHQYNFRRKSLWTVHVRAYLVHQPECNCLVTNKSLVMTFCISNALFQPPSVGERVNNITHFPVLIPLPANISIIRPKKKHLLSHIIPMSRRSCIFHLLAFLLAFWFSAYLLFESEQVHEITCN